MKKRTSGLDRRALLALAGATALSPRVWAAAPQTIPTAGFSHVRVSCSNLERSLDFYQRLLGLTAAADGAVGVKRLRIGPGAEVLELQQANEATPVGLAAFGLATFAFDRKTLVKRFEAMSLAVGWTGQPAHTASLSDPDDLSVEIRKAVPSAMTVPTNAAIAPLTINHVTLTVTELKRSLDYYQRIFGLPMQTEQGSTPVLGVGPAEGPVRPALGFIAGPKAEINHVCLGVAGFDPARIMRRLHEFGISSAESMLPKAPLTATIRWRQAKNNGGGPDAPLGTPELHFSDPDNIIMQLQDVSYCAGSGFLGNVCAA